MQNINLGQKENNEVSHHKGDWKLKYGGWTVEFLAASTGVGIALTQYNREGLFGFIKSGSIVFFIIALLELSKIPLLNSMYRTKSFIWRCFFVIAFIFSVIITFETFFLSLQMNYINQTVKTTIPYKDSTISLEQAYSEIESIEQAIKNLEAGGKENLLEKENLIKTREQTIKNRDDDLANIQQQIDAINTQNTETSNKIKERYADTEKSYNQQLNQKNSDLINIKTESKNAQQKVSNTYNSQIQSLLGIDSKSNDSRIKEYNRKVDQNQKEIDDLKQQYNTNKDNIETNYQNAIDKLGKDYNDRLKSIRGKIQNRYTERKNELDRIRKNYNSKRSLENEALREAEKNKSFFKGNNTKQILENIEKLKTEEKQEKENTQKKYDADIMELEKQERIISKEKNEVDTSASARVKKLQKERTEKLQRLETQYKNDLSKLEKTKQDLATGSKGNSISNNPKISALKKQRDNKITEIESKYAPKITALETEIKDLDNKIQHLIGDRANQLQSMSVLSDSELRKQLQDTNNRYKTELQEISDKINDINTQKNKPFSNEKIALREQKTVLQNVVAQIGQKIQIYTLTRLLYKYKWFGEPTEDPNFISRTDLDKIATIWFGSISILSATLGSVLYLGYLIQKYPPNVWFKPVAFMGTALTPIKNLFLGIMGFFNLNRNFKDVPPATLRGWWRKRTRRILAIFYKKAKTPKPVKLHTIEKEKVVYIEQEVPKITEKVEHVYHEIPKIIEKIQVEYVDREVIKEVEKVKIEYVEKEIPKVVEKEVPVEVVKKEYVHVPLYTNDLNLLKIVPHLGEKTKKDKD